MVKRDSQVPNQQAPLTGPLEREHRYIIGTRDNRMERHRCAPGDYPGASVVPGMHGMQKKNVSQGNW
jgi:hypothetical protein